MSEIIKIEHVEGYKIQIPLKKPFKISIGTVEQKVCVIFKLSGNGLSGFGEAAVDEFPFYTSETADTAMILGHRLFAPLLKNKSFRTPEEINALFSRYRGHNFTKSALEACVWDLYGKATNNSVSSLIGGTRKYVECGPSIGIKETPEETIDEVSKCLSEGYKRIKIKVAPGYDIRYIEDIRKSFPDITLMVDANCAYRPEDFDFLQAWDNFGLLMIEQPFNASDVYFHSLLSKKMKTPICLDEGVENIYQAEQVCRMKAADIINIKVARVGGIANSLSINNISQKANMPIWVGSRIGTGISEAARVAVASLPNSKFPTDAFFGKFYMDEDILKQPFEIKDGNITIPQKPGLGVCVDKDKLKSYTIEKFII